MKRIVEKAALAQQEIDYVPAIMLHLQQDANKKAGIRGAAVGAALLNGHRSWFGFNKAGANRPDECHTHAEISAINSLGVDGRGATMVVTRSPCLYCAAHMIAAGISRVYAPPLRPESKWYPSQVEAIYILKAVGIEVINISVDGVKG